MRGGDSPARPVNAGGPWMRALPLPRASSLLRRCMSDGAATHAFGPHRLRASEVFVESRLSLGFVNLKPVVPGECQRGFGLRVARRVPRLTADRRARAVHPAPRRATRRGLDERRSGRLVAAGAPLRAKAGGAFRRRRAHFCGAGWRCCRSDGPARAHPPAAAPAGRLRAQRPGLRPGCHPRLPCGRARAYRVFAQIDESERESTRQRLSKDLDRERVARTPEEMAREADTLRRVCLPSA